jgi:hypothetical protein
VPRRWSLIGGAIILCATAARTLWDARAPSSRMDADRLVTGQRGSRTDQHGSE